MSQPTIFSGVDEIRQTLGETVVVIPCYIKSKRPVGSKWPERRSSEMTPAYLRRLAGRNVGVLLGEASGHLVAIDIDRDDAVEPFLCANPTLRQSLRTHGSKGCVIWLQMPDGEYPASTKKLLTVAGDNWGEWRANNSQSIIYGLHKDTGNPYTVLVKAAPMLVPFSSIVWPDVIANPPMLDALPPASLPVMIQSNRATEATEAVGGQGWLVSSIEEAVEKALPTTTHQNNAKLFLLARWILTLEKQWGRKATPEELRKAFDLWHQRALPFLRPDQSRDDYIVEFLDARGRAKHPMGTSAVDHAWQAIQSKPAPPEALSLFESNKHRLVVALCKELQRMNGSSPFFLSSRTLQELLGDTSHLPSARLLRALCNHGVLKEVKKGAPGLASRYLYVGSMAEDPGQTQPVKAQPEREAIPREAL